MQEKEVGHRRRSGVLRLEEQALTNQDKSKHMFKVEGPAVSSEERGWRSLSCQNAHTCSSSSLQPFHSCSRSLLLFTWTTGKLISSNVNILISEIFEKIQRFLGSKQTKKLSGKNLNDA